MLHHMMEAQAPTTWLLLEITTTGSVLAWTDTGEDQSALLRLRRACRNATADAHLDATLQVSVPKFCHKLNQVELFGDSQASLEMKEMGR